MGRGDGCEGRGSCECCEVKRCRVTMWCEGRREPGACRVIVRALLHDGLVQQPPSRPLDVKYSSRPRQPSGPFPFAPLAAPPAGKSTYSSKCARSSVYLLALAPLQTSLGSRRPPSPAQPMSNRLTDECVASGCSRRWRPLFTAQHQVAIAGNSLSAAVGCC